MGIETAVMAGGALLGYSAANKARRSAEREAARARAERAEERRKMEARMKKYEDTEYIPIDVEAYKQENVYEDLTVDTTAADYAVKTFGQQQANIMENLRGVAGASGAAGLAQSLSLGAEKQAREVQLTLGQQMQQNRKMQMMEESRLQEQERSLRLADAEGRRRFEIGKMETLMGVQGAQTYGANQAYAQSQTNLMNIQGQQMQLWGQTMNMFGNMDWSALGGTSTDSDRRLKKNIELIGKSPSGLNIYSFEYIDSKYGEGLFQGVMSDEIPQEAVINVNGYDKVNYNMLDVEFKQI